MAEGGQILDVSETEGSNTSDNTMETDTLQVFLDRNRSERENELREIKNTNRPVTGQTSRDRIGHFIAKNIEVREVRDTANATGKENVPLNSPNCEEHRPNAVVVEIQGLSQQQRVSNALQTTAFRRRLENLIRGSIPGSRSPVGGLASRSQMPRPSPAPVQEQVSPASLPNESVDLSDVRPVVYDAVDLSDRESISSVSTVSTNSSVDQASQIRDPRGLLALNHQNVIPPPPPPPPMQQADGGYHTLPHWDDVTDIQRENIVQEISELVHQQLVTSSLEGDFRHRLEYHMQGRLQTTGTDGERVQNFIQSIPQTPHIRNDFSNLGVPSPVAPDNWDNVSVTSITATAVPFRHTNLHLNQEVASLKAQMSEMRNMLKVSFELQMDIQRSIRQEVAAGIAAASGGSTQAPVTIPKSKPVNDTHCVICLDNFSDAVLYQCGHMCVCYPCGRHLMDRNAKCPVCRAPIRDIIKAYRSNED